MGGDFVIRGLLAGEEDFRYTDAYEYQTENPSPFPGDSFFGNFFHPYCLPKGSVFCTARRAVVESAQDELWP